MLTIGYDSTIMITIILRKLLLDVIMLTYCYYKAAVIPDEIEF